MGENWVVLGCLALGTWWDPSPPLAVLVRDPAHVVRSTQATKIRKGKGRRLLFVMFSEGFYTEAILYFAAGIVPCGDFILMNCIVLKKSFKGRKRAVYSLDFLHVKNFLRYITHQTRYYYQIHTILQNSLACTPTPPYNYSAWCTTGCQDTGQRCTAKKNFLLRRIFRAN